MIARGIAHVLGDQYGPKDMSQKLYKQHFKRQREDYKRRMETSGSARYHYSCNVPGVRDLRCKDTPRDEPYRVFGYVEPRKWLDGRPYDPSSSDTLIIRAACPDRGLSRLDVNAKHSRTTAAAMAGGAAAPSTHKPAGAPLKVNVDDYLYYQHFLDLTTTKDGLFANHHEYTLNAEQKRLLADIRNPVVRRRTRNKFLRSIFTHKWVRDFPPSCLARLQIPVHETDAGHQPHLDIEQLYHMHNERLEESDEDMGLHYSDFSESEDEAPRRRADSVTRRLTENPVRAPSPQATNRTGRSAQDVVSPYFAAPRKRPKPQPKTRKKKRRRKKNGFVEDEASNDDGSSDEEEIDSEEEREQQKQLDDEMLDDEGSVGSPFTGRFAAEQAMDARDAQEASSRKRRRQTFDANVLLGHGTVTESQMSNGGSQAQWLSTRQALVEDSEEEMLDL